jgi:hypothetical protein
VSTSPSSGPTNVLRRINDVFACFFLLERRVKLDQLIRSVQNKKRTSAEDCFYP